MAEASGECRIPDHAGSGTTCRGCHLAAEAEYVKHRDLWFKALGQVRQLEKGIREHLRRRAEDDMNHVTAWQLAGRLRAHAAPLREMAGRASMITPDMAKAAHRDRFAALQQAGTEFAGLFDKAVEAAGADACGVWKSWRAENKRLREVVLAAARRLNAERGGSHIDCSCAGCELIREMDRVPVTGMDDDVSATVAALEGED